MPDYLKAHGRFLGPLPLLSTQLNQLMNNSLAKEVKHIQGFSYQPTG
jgi:hypothetical protein